MNGPEYLKHTSGEIVNKEFQLVKRPLSKKRRLLLNRQIRGAAMAKLFIKRLDGK